MTRSLKFGRRAALSGKASSLVVFLHGYGADGADLLGLADQLTPHLPGTVFVAPDAPDACTASAFGRQWFSIPRFDGSTPEVAAAGLAASAGDLAAFLAARMQAEAVSADQVALVGFSQGTMMALHVAPRQSVALAGVVGFSGRLLQPERLVAEALTRPPVLLIHGDADPVVPYSDMAEAEAALDAAGFAVVTHTSQGLGHGISPDGLGLALQFLQDRLGQDRLEPT